MRLAFAEIRFYGASNVQIARRLRAMIINLANTLPAERADIWRRIDRSKATKAVPPCVPAHLVSTPPSPK